MAIAVTVMLEDITIWRRGHS